MRHIRRWGAVYVLLLLFIGSWLGQFFSQLIEFRNEQAAHGEEFAWSDYWPSFIASTLENWQSEWFQLVFQAVLLLGAKHWIFRVDAEDLERVEAKIDDIKDRLGLPTPPPGEEPWEHEDGQAGGEQPGGEQPEAGRPEPGRHREGPHEERREKDESQ